MAKSRFLIRVTAACLAGIVGGSAFWLWHTAIHPADVVEVAPVFLLWLASFGLLYVAIAGRLPTRR